MWHPELGRIQLFSRNALDSLWFVPAVLVAIAIALALVLLQVDSQLERTGERAWWLFAGNADSARAILSVVAGSLITVIAVAFSVTIIAIQQASTQYSPRILRNFTSDRGNQFVLGAYIATFVYALLVLRRVREETADFAGFVPAISISVAVLLALISFGLLVYFIHHATRSLQVSVLLSSIAHEVDRELEHHFPKRVGEAIEPPRSFEELLADIRDVGGRKVWLLRSPSVGYVRVIDSEAIDRVARQAPIEAAVFVAIGDFVQNEEVIARVSCDEALSDSWAGTFRSAFNTDAARTVSFDPAFGIRQIVDIALKALSPGINDPSTAIQCLDYLGNIVASLLGRDLPSSERRIERSRIVFRVPTFEDYLKASFGAIRRAARREFDVTQHLLDVLAKLGVRTKDPMRAAALRQQLDDVDVGLEWGAFTPNEQRSLRQRIERVAKALEC